jgi:P4 family phage/plasmid primase-like protien
MSARHRPECIGHVDLEAATRFITLLAGNERVSFQTFADGSGRPELARIFHGSLGQHADALQRFNQLGAGVFVMVNAGDGNGRKGGNVVRVRALFADLDGAPLEPVLAAPLQPHLVIESSPLRYHAYWLVNDCPLDRFASLQSAVAARFDSDPSVKDLPRVMRVPGFWHQKGVPFQTRFHSSTITPPPYTVGQVVAGLGLVDGPAECRSTEFAPTGPSDRVPVTCSGGILNGSRNATLTSLAGSMRHRGMSFDAIYAALSKENIARCVPPLDDTEVRSIARSVSRYEPGEGTAQQGYTRADLAAMVETTSDFDELTVRIARLVENSVLREAERESLHKQIAKKTKVSPAAVRRDAKSYLQDRGETASDHLRAARAVIRSHGDGNLLHADGHLWVWKGDGVWRRAEDRETKQKIHAVAAISDLTANVVGSILDMVKTEAHRPGHRFDQNPDGINCVNGELVFQDGRWVLHPHNREHYRTAMIPVAYDPMAQAPRFNRFLQEVFEGDTDKDDKSRVVLESLGYTLVPNCHLEKFFMLIGAGANGKSVLLGVVSALVGREHVCAVQPSQFENRFQRGHLQGRLANIITEIAEGAEIADAQLKSLVSGEMTTAEHKHKDPFDFIPYAKHWFGTNHLPHTRDFSDALFRRAVILTFNNKFEGERRDVHLADALKGELPGVFNMALAGLQRLITNKAFTECRSSVDIARQWRTEADQVAQFVEDSCFIGPNCRATSNDLFSAYRMWTISAGIRRALNRNNFTTRLNRLGYESRRGAGGTRMIEGICPRPELSAHERQDTQFLAHDDGFADLAT